MASIQARFWEFAKRENSTARPATAANVLNIVLKDATDLMNPTIEVHQAHIFWFNYCYIDFTSRYYFINAVESIAKDTYLLHLTCDVLATYRDNVMGQSVFAITSSYDYDEWLEDDRVTTGHNVDTEFSTQYTPQIFRPIDPITHYAPLTECIGLITEHGQLNGIDVLYGDIGANAEIMRRFADLNFIDAIKSGSPWDAVCESYYVPYNVPACHSVESHHYTKCWGIDINDKDIIKKPLPKRYRTSISVPLPSNLDFRFTEKYVKYYLHIPFSGVITIPTSLVYADYAQNGVAFVYVTYSADCISGQFAAFVQVGDVPLGYYGANLKINMPLGGRQSQASLISSNAASGAAGIAAAAALGGGLFTKATLIAAGVGATLGAIKGAIDIPPVNSFGNFGGSGALSALREDTGDLYVIKVETDSNIDPATLGALVGRPSGKRTTIQNGYIQTANASVAFAGTPDEIRQFNSLLNGGIYVE